MEHYETIVVGSSFDAVIYAFVHGHPIFFAEERRPSRFDYIEPALNLSCLKIPDTATILETLDASRTIGYPKELLWEKLLFLMAVEGRSPLSNLCGTMRCDGKTVVCSNEYAKIMEFAFERCIYFGDNKAYGFVEEKPLDSRTYLCYDHIGFHSGGKHNIDYIQTNDEFVKEVWFYASDRIDGNTPVKDACTVSVLTAEQIKNFDYSQTMARFKLIHEMESRGMKGKYAGTETKAGSPKHYKFRTTSLFRETGEIEGTTNPSLDSVEIGQKDEKNILQYLPTACLAYDRLLRYW